MTREDWEYLFLIDWKRMAAFRKEVIAHDRRGYQAFQAAGKLPEKGIGYQAMLEERQLADHLLFVSFYTKDYAEPAERLRKTLDAFHLPHEIVKVKSKGDWYANVRHKPAFLLEQMEAHRDVKRIVWLDADSEVMKFPTLLYECDHDIAVHWYNFRTPVASTVLVRNTRLGRDLVKKWRDKTKALPKGTKCPEQSALSEVMRLSGMPWAQLPWGYSAIWRWGAPKRFAVIRSERWGRNIKPK